MKIAIPIWEEIISPVLDTAELILILDLESNKREYLELKEENLYKKANILKKSGIETIICGGISKEFYTILESLEIKIIPWRRGKVEEIIDAYKHNTLNIAKFGMPGCRRRRRRRKGWNNNNYKTF